MGLILFLTAGQGLKGSGLRLKDGGLGLGFGVSHVRFGVKSLGAAGSFSMVLLRA